jgi:hypothetical protein
VIDNKKEVTMRDLMKYQRPTYLIILGLLSSVATSASLPLFGYILAQMVFSLLEDPKED